MPTRISSHGYGSAGNRGVVESLKRPRAGGISAPSVDSARITGNQNIGRFQSLENEQKRLA